MPLVNKGEPLMLGYGLLVSCYSRYPSGVQTKHQHTQSPTLTLGPRKEHVRVV